LIVTSIKFSLPLNAFNIASKVIRHQGRSRGGGLPIEMLLQAFRLNFSREMPKMPLF